jgi:hypothetical protein
MSRVNLYNDNIAERNVKMSNAESKSTESKSPALIAWHVRKGGERSYWDRVGVVFAHKDGQGFDLILDAVPVDGRVTLRAPSEKPDQAAA